MPILAFLRVNAPWLAAGVLLTFLSGFGQTFFISIFAGEIRDAVGLSHGEWGGIYTLGTAVSALAMIWAGGLTDRFRVRVLGTAVLCLLMFSCLFMALNNAVWLLPAVVFALRFTGQGMASHIAVVAMSRWFVGSRGKALSVATLGFAVGEALLPLLFVALMLVYDWRLLWGVAGIVAVAGIPVLLLLLRRERTPQSMAQSGQSNGMEGRHWTRNQTLRHFLFWFMIPSLLGPSAFNTAFFFHQVHFADIKHMAHVELVALFIEDLDLLHCAAFPFSREVGASSGVARPLSREALEASLAHQARRVKRALRQAAKGKVLRHRLQVNRGQVVSEALAEASAYDVLVLGKAGLSARWGNRLGSTSYQLILQAPCTMIIWDERHPPEPGPLRYFNDEKLTFPWGKTPEEAVRRHPLFLGSEELPPMDALKLEPFLTRARRGALVLRRERLIRLLQDAPDLVARIPVPIVVVP